MLASPRSFPAARPVAPGERRRRDGEARPGVEEGFSLQLQPRVALADGAVCCVDAVVRLAQRRRSGLSGSLPAADAGPEDETGWSLRAACAAAAGWPGPAPDVSVPLGPGTVPDAALLGRLACVLEGSGLPPERLELSFTEASLATLDSDGLLVLSVLRDHGIGVAWQGFGAGPSSLSLLRRLPVSIVRVHSSVVRSLCVSREERAVLHATAGVARAAGLRVGADGVDSPAQQAILLAGGCDEAQGPLFGLSYDPPAQACATRG